MSEFLLLILGIIVLAGFGLLYFKLGRTGKNGMVSETDQLKKEVEDLTGDKRVAEEQIRMLKEQLVNAISDIAKKDAAFLDLNKQLSAKSTEFDNSLEKLKEQKGEVEKLQEKFRLEFRNLANEILEEKTMKFTEQNRTKLDEILKPLGEKIRDFEKKVEETYDKESKQRFSLEREIRNLADLNQQISADAKNLTTALKMDTKKQGNWGELVLERVLESSGLVRGQEYTREVSTRTNQGDIYRPDVIVNLPDNKHIIIDSKVSLVAYNDFVAAETLEEKEKQMKLHLYSLRNHVKMLSEKNYQNLEAFDTPDYVLLFIPIESSFSLAIQSDADLFSFAWERNVVIVSPTTLLATLKTVASIWKHEKQTQNAIEIARQGGLLYDKFVLFLADLDKLGNQIETVRKTYDDAHRKLSSGSGNLIGKVEKLKELGAKAGKEIPRSLLEKSDEG
ncbi:MAG: DNA recombination protein RmuC [Bacteroidales bacterium]|jgi:DNA recombination protein RmuC|nr:DNA recombination protein RmuC [Bacteroidales bacterium]